MAPRGEKEKKKTEVATMTVDTQISTECIRSVLLLKATKNQLE